MAGIENIELGGKEIAYTVKKSSRARMVRLTAVPGEGFVVTVPFWVTSEQVRRLLLKKKRWILGRLA
jgi:predicted metal-dependent hydrolase